MPTAETAISQAMDLARQGRTEQAIDALRRASQRWSTHAGLHSAISGLLAHSGRHDQAIYHAERACELAPRDAFFRTNLGGLLLISGRHDRALAAFDAAIGSNPGSAPAHSGRASCLHIRGELGDALQSARRAVELSPGAAQPSVVLARLLHESGRTDEGVDQFTRVLPSIQGPPRMVALAELAQMLLYAGRATGEQVRSAHAEFAREIERSVDPLPPPAPPAPGPRPLRIGYLSGDFRAHSVAAFIEPVLASHDRSAVQVTCFQTSAPAGDDAVTARLRALGHAWVHAHDSDGPALARTIRDHSIDVLVELSGLTPGQRLRALALRPAPVQLSYLGYPHATGLRAIDLRISDGVADPEPDDDGERVARSDPCFLCFHPPEVPAVPAARDPDRPPVFVSFNNISKVNDAVLDAWSSILRRSPGSRLLLKSFRLSDAKTRQDLAARLKARGVTDVEVLARAASPAEHLGLYAGADIALDTFPYNGTTTTFEALFMGVPVVTLRGRSHRARVGASILSTLKTPELIAEDADDYVARAAELAADRQRLARYRSTLRERLLASALCDAASFTRRLESLYLSCFQSFWRSRGHERAGGAP